jgi:hypothetical protein
MGSSSLGLTEVEWGVGWGLEGVGSVDRVGGMVVVGEIGPEVSVVDGGNGEGTWETGVKTDGGERGGTDGGVRWR